MQQPQQQPVQQAQLQQQQPTQQHPSLMQQPSQQQQMQVPLGPLLQHQQDPQQPNSGHDAVLRRAVPTGRDAVLRRAVPHVPQPLRTGLRTDTGYQQPRQSPPTFPVARSPSMFVPVPDPWGFSGGFGLHGPADPFNDDDPIEGAVSEAAAAQPEPESDVVVSEGALSLSTRVEYSALPCGQTQDFFGLVTVKAAEARTPEEGQQAARQPMDIVCVLDVSSSMSGDKIRQVQNAMRFIIEQADRKDRISMVTFNSFANRVLKLRKMDSQGKNDAIVATLRLAASGGTSIAAGLGMAMSVMEGRRLRNKVSAILLLTDGQDGSSQYELPGLMQRASRASSAVYAFGFGADHDAGLLSQIAEQAHTPFTFVERTEHISEAFAGCVGGLTSIVAQRVELTLRGHVPIKSVHTGFEVRRVSDTEAVVVFSDMFGGERRDILVELAVPAADAGVGHFVLLDASARYLDLWQNATVQSPPTQMEAARVEEPQPEMEPDEEVTAQRERVEVTRALQQAASHGDRGDFEGAQRVLHAADQRMKQSKTLTSTNAVLVQELDDARRRMQSRAAWEQGGRAEVLDCAQMHSMQRCTNLSGPKSSKAMYSNSVQTAWIQSSSASRTI